VSERLDTETVVDGRYRVLDRVGSGGMADVYCAEDLQLGRKVALKVLHRRFAEDREFVERFRREASSAAGLQHQHVVSVYDRGEYDGTYYIAMEYLDGRSLKQVVAEEGPLHPDRAIDLTLQILRAARFAHRRGVIHRDLKPHNVIVDEEDRAKVTDFGIARAGASDMTQTGSIMGTAQYLSPEQAQGTPVSEASDIYSVGVILYELLTGRVPFDGESAVTIALKHVNEAPVPPSAYNAAVGPALDAVVLRAMEKDPTVRYRDADELIAALEAVRTATGVTAIAPVGPPTMVEPLPPRDAYVYPAEPLPPRPQREGARWWWWVLALLLVAGAIVAGVLLLNGRKATVPQVVGTDRATAVSILSRDGFGTTAQGRTSSRPKGEVLAQDPAAGTRIKKGSTVALTVSDGPAQTTVPVVEGLTAKSAEARLKKAGLSATATPQESDSVDKGKVISASPAAGQQVDRGSTVDLVVSSGPASVAVPPVTDQTFADAKSALVLAGFTVARKDQESTDKPADTVLAQDPAGGGKAPKGSTVTLTVAKGPPDVTVPDMTGETVGSAVRRLSKEGFEVDQTTQDVNSQEGDGIVIDQSPKTGKAKKGSKVTIVVGRYNPATPTTPATPATPTPPAPGATP
jgi:eukaryotic-like serine/threonine-protein kinase